ncbi:MAG: cation-transporting P-type ATPase [Geminicoccaceae bacterium]
MKKATSPMTAVPDIPEDLEKADLQTVYTRLKTSTDGLSTAEAGSRLETYGRNELIQKDASDLEKFLRFFWGPIAWMIEAAAVLSLLMGHWADLAIIWSFFSTMPCRASGRSARPRMRWQR